GASLDGTRGENHDPETHIIPVALNAIKNNEEFTIYGTDYNTLDGTCVRDYIHVLDLAIAHILALEKIIREPGAYTYNVGTGSGYSNREIVKTIEEVTGKSLSVVDQERRPGDADTLVADVSRIKQDLGFDPQYSDLKTIISTAWKWHNK
ncbi:MAG: GDP-mannose 4,6-dehydratase, partial [Candidatus Levybacteria bacterium]|nr:GDP-mannose 4,6-dehydratase [Candidatus Levybacteria bacterium]